MPLVFPGLFLRPNHIEWPAEITGAYQSISALFQRAKALASLINPDPVCARLVISEIFTTGAETLLGLEEQLPDEEWITNCAAVLFAMASQVGQAADAADGQ
jgi:hypothetical protein